MSRVPSVPLDAAWDQLSAADRDRLAGRLGKIIAALPQLTPSVISDWWPAGLVSFRGRAVRGVSVNSAP